MPGRIQQWPAWPEFGGVSAAETKDPDFITAKQSIIAKYGVENLKKSWITVCEQLESVTAEIASQGSEAIPVLSAETLLKRGFGDSELANVKRTGCLIVKGVVPRAEAEELYQSLRHYVDDNRANIMGWPVETPSMLMLYNSPVQNMVRTHPNHLKLQRKLNELWHDETGETSPEPLIYLDGVRDRPPHQPFLGLGPHIDAGSLSRWADPAYREVYSRIFLGQPEAHDCWDLGARKDAKQNLFESPAHSTVFRSFQGWTAMTRTAPNEGTIMLMPNLDTTLAYMLLRPFFNPPTNPEQILDASKWTLDDSGSFPGTLKPQSQRLSRSSHPHLRLEQCLVHVPTMEPGDTVWWHTDLCHAVDPEHQGTQNASVIYIPACPTTPANEDYVKRQLEATLAGKAPPDYSGGSNTNETLFKGYKGHTGMTNEARKAFGYDMED